MAAIVIANNNTPATLLAQDPSYAPRLWAKGVEIAEQNENFFEQFEGPGEDSPIQTASDLNKDAGEAVHFRTMEGLYGEGVMGDELVGDKSEPFVVGGYDLIVDYLRHATERTKRLETKLAIVEELRKGVPIQLGKWMGRKKTQRLMMMFREKGGAANNAYANKKASRDALKSGDIIRMDDITNNGQVLKTNGGQPAMVGTDANGGDFKRFITIPIGEAATNMQTSSDYKQAQRDAGLRGGENLIFKGGFDVITGHIIKPYDPIDHAGAGSIGSPWNPKAKLGGAITAGTTVIDILGGGTAINGTKLDPRYFEFFSNYAYRFQPSDVLAPNTATERYFLIINPSNAVTDPGKACFYAFTSGNNGNKITITKRLGPTTTGAQYATIGNVTWETGAWLTGASGFAGCTQTHPVGATILETNSYGVPFGKFLMIGAKAAKRAYGKYNNKRTEQMYDGEFVMQTFIMSVFGQSPVVRSDGLAPSFVMVEHAINYAGINTPFVV